MNKTRYRKIWKYGHYKEGSNHYGMRRIRVGRGRIILAVICIDKNCWPTDQPKERN